MIPFWYATRVIFQEPQYIAVMVCHFGAVRIQDGVRRYDSVCCMGCELWVEHCPDHLLALTIDPDKPLPLDLTREMMK